jgi:hypothetical protein
VGGATLLLASLDRSPALKLARRHLVESSQESGLHAGEPFERWAVVGSESATVGTSSVGSGSLYQAKDWALIYRRQPDSVIANGICFSKFCKDH